MRKLDPALVRLRILEVLDEHTDEAHLRALDALADDDFDLHDDPVNEEVVVAVGDMVLVLDRRLCTVTTEQWFVASEREGFISTDRPRRLRTRSDDRGQPIPQGQLHAHRHGASTTACGHALAELTTWDDRPFNDWLLNRCPRCVDAVSSRSS